MTWVDKGTLQLEFLINFPIITMIIKIICLGLALFLVPVKPHPIFEFPFPTIGNVLEENQRLKEENKWLNDIIAKNISDLAEQITSVRTEHTIEKIATMKTGSSLDAPIGKVDY